MRRFEIPLAFTVAGALALSGCLDRALVPLNPCLVSNVVDTVQSRRIDKVDILFVVDDSSSMEEEQASLERELPALMRALATGDRDRDGVRDFEPVTDLHLGVVSTDMGVPGAIVQGCNANGQQFGLDGVLQHAPRQARPECDASYPSFLTFRSGDDPEMLAQDFACIARLGTDGCGLEQQLEAPLKALWPSLDLDPQTGQPRNPNRVRFLGDVEGPMSSGHGDRENAGFLRGPAEGTSILAVVLVTDEEDCSMLSTGDIASIPAEELGLRCFNHKEALYGINRYVEGLKALRPDDPDLVLFAAITGVPEALVSESVLKSVDLANPAQREAFYERILNDPLMQERIQTPTDDGTTMGAGAGPLPQLKLVPSCNSGRGVAYPPRRIVEVARAFGENGVVTSICQESFAPAIDAIVKLIAAKLTSLCLPRPFVRDSSGHVDCDIVWELPIAGREPAGTPTRCSDNPLLEPLEPATAQRGERCRVPQLGFTSETAVLGAVGASGWYYDDFSTDRTEECGSAHPQRLAFTQSAEPPNGVKVKLECLDQSAKAPSAGTGPRAPSFARIGAACDRIDSSGAVLSDDSACVVPAGMQSIAAPLFCHPELNVCVLPCGSDAECPPSWRCDSRPDTIAQTPAADAPEGRAFCVNPTCDADQ